MLSETAQNAINAYGGIESWRNLKYIEAEVSVKGLAFTLKRRPFFEHVKIQMEVGKPFSRITPIGKDKNISGVLDGNNVRLENQDGIIIAERNNARDFFPYGRRLLYWDDLDMAYFANYALWNYFTLPRLLTNDEIIWTEKADGVLEAIFPDNYPTHSKIQEFHFDKTTGVLIQHNYTAEVISKLAKAANVVKEQKIIKDILFPVSRIVTPRNSEGKALKKPILIDIKVHNVKLINKS